MAEPRNDLAFDWSRFQKHLHKKVKPSVRRQVALMLGVPINFLIESTARQIENECGVSCRDALRSARTLVREILNGMLESQALAAFQEDRHKTYSGNRGHLAVVAARASR